MRKFHRIAGVFLISFFVLSAFTGILWAFSPFLYWKDNYLRPKKALPLQPLTDAVLTNRDVITQASRTIGVDVSLLTLGLRTLGGVLIYDLRYKKGAGESTLLVDAKTGQKLSPLSQEFAAQIASQYVEAGATIQSIRHVPEIELRNGKIAKEIDEVSFNNPNHSVIVLDSSSGAILEEYDDSRRIHFLVMKLHTLSFFGFHKTLAAIPGLGLLTMTFSGSILWLSNLKRRNKANANSPSI